MHSGSGNFSCGAIVAVGGGGLIGIGGKLPWHYPEDLKRFKRLTLDTTVIMGRITWESIGARQLPRRRNIVITRSRLDGVACYPHFEEALATCDGRVWVIGGAQLYAGALAWCDVVDLTCVPERPEGGDGNIAGAVYFPALPESEWLAQTDAVNPHDPRLRHRRYVRHSRDSAAT